MTVYAWREGCTELIMEVDYISTPICRLSKLAT